ncbi:hypothetical protein TrLO_g609 [Triparma laevis f. longispina]|uniref:Uncharacterized protein n=1 Tax=Triparma laevis f. longispina TaxID=1714387 RepID=A0A9W7FA07_9STRA|nr:hypothetical protein TrLO_g609 [Triparma laevis f. longispina]
MSGNVVDVVWEEGEERRTEEILSTLAQYPFIRLASFQHFTSLRQISLKSLSIKVIEAYSFYKCTSLESIKLDSDLEIIQSNAFEGCINLSVLELPKNLQKLGSKVFLNCIKLSRLNVPPALLDKKERDGPLPLVEWEGYNTFVKNSNNCGDNIFEGCISIAPKEILSKLLTAESDTNILSYLKILATLRYNGEHDVRIPKSKKRAYQEIEFKRDIKWERPSGKELVLGMIKGKISSQFQYLVSIKHIDLTSAGFQKTNANMELREGGLQEIGSSTFFCCTGLQVIYLPISLRRIGEQAFGGCENLQEVCVKETGKLPKVLEHIGKGAFTNCFNLIRLLFEDNFGSKLNAKVLGTSDRMFSNDSLDIFLGCSKIAPKDALKSDHEVLKYLLTRFTSINKLMELCTTGGPLTKYEVNGEVKVRTLAEEVKYLLKKHPDQAFKSNEVDGMTPLHFLCMNITADFEVVRAIVETNPAALHNITDANSLWEGVNFTPLHIAREFNLPEEIQRYLFRCGPIGETGGEEKKMKNEGKKTFREQASDYLFDLELSSPHSILKNIKDIHRFPDHLQHGFVMFVSAKHGKSDNPIMADDYELGKESEIKSNEGMSARMRLMQFIQDEDKCSFEMAKILAMSRDTDGQRVIDIAHKEISEVLKEKVFFLGRFDMSLDNIIHQSSTSCVMEVIDDHAGNDYRRLFREINNDGLNSFTSTEISRQTIESAISQLGLDVDDEMFEHFYKFWDLDKSGEINEAEFETFCMRLNGFKPRKVVIKLMLSEHEFMREVDARQEAKKTLGKNNVNKINWKNVNKNNKNMLCILDAYKGLEREEYWREVRGDDLKGVKERVRFNEDLKYIDSSLAKFKFAIVLPSAGRNLESMFRFERPSKEEIRNHAKHTALAIQHLHSAKVVHGDIKMMNIIRFGGKLRLLDFDSSLGLSTERSQQLYAGVKCSSGNIPPELIYRFQNAEEQKSFEQHFFKTGSIWEKLDKDLDGKVAPEKVIEAIEKDGKIANSLFLNDYIVGGKLNEKARAKLVALFKKVDFTDNNDPLDEQEFMAWEREAHLTAREQVGEWSPSETLFGEAAVWERIKPASCGEGNKKETFCMKTYKHSIVQEGWYLEREKTFFDKNEVVKPGKWVKQEAPDSQSGYGRLGPLPEWTWETQQAGRIKGVKERGRWWSQDDQKSYHEDAIHPWGTKTMLSRDTGSKCEWVACVWRRDKPADSENLPYELVESTAAIDIWAFGSLLYALTAGSPLFHVNREDALNAGSAYKKLHDWNEGKKMLKLDENKECKHDFVLKDLLMKLLARDPEVRPKTMAEVLDHAYFKCQEMPKEERAKTEAEYEETLTLYHLRQKRKEAAKVLEVYMTESQIGWLRRTTSSRLTNIFKPDLCDTPSSIILMPYDAHNEVENDLMVKLKKMETALKWLKSMLNLIPGSESVFSSPFLYRKYLGSKDFADAVEKHIFSNNWGAKKEGYRPQSEFPGFFNLYLVDENDGKLIVGEGYPVKIDMEKDKELLESLIPLCRVTMQSIALRLGGAGIVKMFCDFVDKVEVLNEITNYAEDLVHRITFEGRIYEVEYKSIWEKLDQNLDGKVTKEEVIKAIEKDGDIAISLFLDDCLVGGKLNDRAFSKLVALFEKADLDNNGSLDQQKFMAWEREAHMTAREEADDGTGGGWGGAGSSMKNHLMALQKFFHERDSEARYCDLRQIVNKNRKDKNDRTHLWGTVGSAAQISFEASDAGIEKQRILEEKEEEIKKLRAKVGLMPKNGNHYTMSLARLLPLENKVDLRAIEVGVLDEGEAEEVDVKEEFEKLVKTRVREEEKTRIKMAEGRSKMKSMMEKMKKSGEERSVIRIVVGGIVSEVEGMEGMEGGMKMDRE